MAKQYILKETHIAKNGSSYTSYVITENGFGIGVMHLGNKKDAKRFSWSAALKLAKKLGDRYTIEPDTEDFNVVAAVNACVNHDVKAIKAHAKNWPIGLEPKMIIWAYPECKIPLSKSGNK